MALKIPKMQETSRCRKRKDFDCHSSVSEVIMGRCFIGSTAWVFGSAAVVMVVVVGGGGRGWKSISTEVEGCCCWPSSFTRKL